jgi:hypothetical protein
MREREREIHAKVRERENEIHQLALETSFFVKQSSEQRVSSLRD